MKKRTKDCSAGMTAEEALAMHRMCEENFWKLMMIWTDNNQKIERLVSKAERKSTYWKKQYDKLMAAK